MMESRAELLLFFLPMAGTILGLIIGSFLATLIVRWPQGQSVVIGRSNCDSCGHQLGFKELIPVVSYVWQRGRCKSCGSHINNSHLAIELAAALIGGVALFVAPNIVGLTGALFGWLLLTLAALDAEHQWLPDKLTAVLAITGFLSTFIVELPSLVDRSIGGIAGYFSLYLLAVSYRMVRNKEGMGGGDPKMLGGIGLWLGWQPLPLVLLGAAILGLVFAIMLKIRRQSVGLGSQLPLGSLMALSAFPLWLLQAAGFNWLG